MSIRSKSDSKNRSGNTVKVPLIVFKEDDSIICYCPALDLAGYGHNEREAISSYKYVMDEYLDHIAQNHTLKKDLKRLGWQIKDNLQKNIIPPPVSKLLESNSNFRRVFDKFDYKKLSTNIHFPAVQ